MKKINTYKTNVSFSLITITFLVVVFFFKVIFAPVNVAEAIIDGEEYPESTYPNVARLISLGGRDINNEDVSTKNINDYKFTFCTGTLISSKHVLTAGHCLYDQKSTYSKRSNEIRVRLNGVDYQSKSFYVHPDYIDKKIPKEIDAAIIELLVDVKNVIPATLNTGIVPIGETVTFLGYGLLGNESHNQNTEGTLPPLGKVILGQNYIDGYGSYILFEDNISYNVKNTNYFHWKFDSCSNSSEGDSGGPVFYKGSLAGINAYAKKSSGSTANFCGLNSYSFKTRVDLIVPWTKNVLLGKIVAAPNPLDINELPPNDKEFDLTISSPTQFSGMSIKYPGITFNGNITPKLSGNILEINGEVTYNYTTPSAPSDIIKGGEIAISIYDKEKGFIIDSVNLGSDNTIIEYNTPYQFSIKFYDYISELEKKINSTPEYPIKVKISDLDLGLTTDKLVIIEVIDPSNESDESNQSLTQQPTNQNNGNGTTTTKIEFSNIIDATDKDDTSATVTSSVTFKNTGKGTADIPAGSTVVLKALDPSNNVAFTSTNLIPPGSKYNTAIPLTVTATGLNKTKAYLMIFSATDGTIKDIKSGSKQFSFAGNIPPNDPNNPADNGGKIKLKNPTPFNSIIELVNALVKNVVIPIAVPFLALAIMYTGFLFVTAKGNTDKITKAKEALKYTLFGGAIILAAYVIATALQGTINDIIK